MSIDLRSNYDISSFYQGFEAPECGIFDQDNEPDEEITCKRCGEIEEECLCDHYDNIEINELLSFYYNIKTH